MRTSAISASFVLSRRRLAGVGVCGGFLAACGSPQVGPVREGKPTAEPGRFDPARRMGATVWDQPSPHYRFERLPLVSADGQRRYRLWLAVPRDPALATGHPVICMLDGNAVADTLKPDHFAALARAGRPPVIAALGPDSDLRFDVAMRAFDYTPPLRSGGPIRDDVERGRREGGADLLLNLIERELLPAVAAYTPIDGAARTLWGHSYGGLFVLHALLRRPALFARYAAADPSLWWQDGFILQEAQHPALLPPGRETTLLLMQGSAATTPPPAPPVAASDPARVERARERAAVPPDSGMRLVEALGRRPGMRAEYRLFPGVPHGPLLAASIGPALELASRVA